jgi:hypothetical protein
MAFLILVGPKKSADSNVKREIFLPPAYMRNLRWIGIEKQFSRICGSVRHLDSRTVGQFANSPLSYLIRVLLRDCDLAPLRRAVSLAG